MRNIISKLEKRLVAVILVAKYFLGPFKKYFVNYVTILAGKLGCYRALSEWRPVDAEGNPIPWFPYSAIEFLETLNLSEKTVFEFGAGNSTLWWAKRAKKVISVEVDKKWFDIISTFKPHNSEIVLQENEDLFANEINKLAYNLGGGGYDIILIDSRRRLECVKNAISHVADGGIIIIDDAQRYHKMHQYLLDNGFFYVNFNDFKAQGFGRHSTAVFIKNSGVFSFKQTNTIPCIGQNREPEEWKKE